MQIICFEDDRVEQLRPIVHARPAYAISCASFRLIDWLRQLDGSLHGSVRTFLAEIQALDFALDPLPTDFDARDGLLLVNARLAPVVGLDRKLNDLAQRSVTSAIVDSQDGSLLAARIPAAALAAQPIESLESLFEIALATPPINIDLAVFRWPHDVIAHHLAGMSGAMQWRIDHGDYRQLSDGLFVKSNESLGQYISIDVAHGPVLLDEDVQIGPFTHLAGPLHIGPHSRIAEHAAIKDCVSLGHTVKLGGEVEASIIEPYTNKQHHGFLGHSYLGSWINLGAGTCNSDLKNTYGTINADYGNKKVNAGMQFLGCFMGDYSKTAINTSIFTGKVIGVCSMLYGFVPTNVPSFVNYGRTFGQTSQLPPDVMITTQQRMFARRNVQQRECDKQLIRDMYERSSHERDTAEFEIL
jgi:glucose-1-phosphate thymidylyltransferase